MPASTVTAAQRKTPAGRVPGGVSTKSAPVNKVSGAVRGGPANGAVKRAGGAANGASGAASAAGGAVNGLPSNIGPYGIMASRIANRFAEMAENYTFVEKPKAQPAPVESAVPDKKKPRKLEIRLQGGAPDSVSFSPAFLDNTLRKMLDLQTRMLRVSAELGSAEDVSDDLKKEQFGQTSELSRIIALICAEKARQGA